MAAPLSIAIDPCEPVGVDQVTIRQQVVVYPNPSNSEVTVRTPFHGDWQLSVMDTQGRAVRNDAFVGQEQTLTGLPSGLYTIAVSNGPFRSVQRIVVSGH